MILFYNMIIWLLALLRWGLILLFCIVAFGLARPYISSVSSYEWLRPVIEIDQALNTTVKTVIPTKVYGYDISRVVTLIVILIMVSQTHSIAEKAKFAIQRRKMYSELKHMQKQYQSAEHQDKIALLQSTIEQAHHGSGKSRHELLKDFASIKKELEKIGRDLAFLSIDVVDSTSMKIDEDNETVESDFLEYHNFIEAKCKEHGLIKATWTPDGLMACFNTLEEAVSTAQDVLHDLDYFNQHVKLMKRPFIIRCGINHGHVFYDDSLPLESLSDRVVDIAGHMQKNAPPNSILVAKQFIEPIKSWENFVPSKRVIDGLEVCEWLKIENNTKSS